MTAIPHWAAAEIGKWLIELAWFAAGKPHFIAVSNALYAAAQQARDSGETVAVTITVNPGD